MSDWSFQKGLSQEGRPILNVGSTTPPHGRHRPTGDLIPRAAPPHGWNVNTCLALTPASLFLSSLQCVLSWQDCSEEKK